MSKPRSTEKIAASDFVSIGELAEISGVRYSTLKHYTEIGLLEFQQIDAGLKRLYPKNQSIKRLREILALKTEKRFTIPEILQYFTKPDIK
jgi:DNA-binding transcriptional MerR regulator